MPWGFLRAARDRGTALSLVLNRVPEDAGREVPAHLRRMLADEGLPEADVLVIPETPPADGLLPAPALAPARAWLDDLAADAQARAALVRRTLRGALASSPPVALVEVAAVQQLGCCRASGGGRRRVRCGRTGGRSGSAEWLLLRGEVLARWHEVVGTGDVMRALESRAGWARDRLKSLLTGKPAADDELREAVEDSRRGCRARRGRARRRADGAGLARPRRRAGAPRWDDRPDRASAEPEAGAEEEVRAWQGVVFDLVREEGGSKRATARLASLGVNGAGLTVMLAVFAQTGGLTGAEVVVAGGTSAVAQKVLEAIFGDQAVRTLAAQARGDLFARVDRLLREDAARFDVLLDGAVPEAESFARLHEAVEAIRRAA